MSKSRYSKTKAAGELVGLNRTNALLRSRPGVVQVENRAMRRARDREKNSNAVEV